MANDVLSLFHPAVAQWFGETFSEPTPPQSLGWPHIAAGEHTLILAPTGSGKTLAAFLCAIDSIVRAHDDEGMTSTGVHTLYISPLKALAQDIERNLTRPLAGIRACSSRLGQHLPEIHVGVRTGDTDAADRQRMVRVPPQLLITTPESLHLLLTSPRARDMLRTVRYVIVDEIHALCPSKRGTFLSLLLERLEALVARPPVRVGLSATLRPLDSIARFLGGQHPDGTPRAVSVVDAGMRRNFDLLVEPPVPEMTALPAVENHAPSIWPAIYDRLVELVDEHETTLIFANSRRTVERIAAEMNRRIGYERIRAHHGSISKEKRQEVEADLKEGRLPALVATSSMELGIDVGSIDLVCQVESPFSVASGLQRIGRAGHLVRATSKGRVIPKTRADLLLGAAMSRSMLKGEISAVSIPHNPLDVLAQQVVAMVAVDEWEVDAVFDRVRCAFPYRDLSHEVFRSVLELVCGGFRAPQLPLLRPKIAWDRVHDRLTPLPGSRHVAILNGGAIPDSGQYAMVLEDQKTRLGELDEEFVFERRIGDTFVMGTGVWRIVEITHDRVMVAPCEQTEAMMPFWKGEGLGHDWEFGVRWGEFIRSCEERLSDPTLESWLCSECAVTADGAKNLIAYLTEQRQSGSALPTDRTILVDVFLNDAGDQRVAILSTFGRSFHLALLLLLQSMLRDRGAEPVEAVYSNAGILLRTGGTDAATILDVLNGMQSDQVTEWLVRELDQSPVFALRFRRNAARALLLPKARPGRRTPLWLQRLKSYDLLSFASRQPEFPIVLETYRELLEDDLPLAGLREFLDAVRQGEARFALRRDRRPSPFSASLLLDFTARFLYLEDRPVRTDRAGSRWQDELAVLLGDPIHAVRTLDEDAIMTVQGRLQGVALLHHARNGAEVIELLARVGDLSQEELAARCTPEALACLPDLLQDGRVVHVRISGSDVPDRLAAGHEAARFEQPTEADHDAQVARYVAHHGITKADDLVRRYPQAQGRIERVARDQGWVRVDLEDGTTGWCDPQVFASIRRLTMSRRRRQVEAISPASFTCDVLTRQHVGEVLGGDGVTDVMSLFLGMPMPASSWHAVLSARIGAHPMQHLSELTRDGRFVWYGELAGGQRRVAFADSPDATRFRSASSRAQLGDPKSKILDFLTGHGACFLHQLSAALGMPPSATAEQLWDLIWDGWVTNDSLDPAWSDRPQPGRWTDPRRGPPWGRGRWSALPNLAEGREEEDLRGAIRNVLRRYGVVTREILASENAGVSWGEAYPLLTRMEWAGDVERAFFVGGMSGPQFASREAVRAMSAPRQDVPAVFLNVHDPANLYGRVFPILRPNGERYVVRHHPGNYLVLENGQPLLAVENRGERLISLCELSPAQRKRAVALLPQLVADKDCPPSIRVSSWDGTPAAVSAAEADLTEVGFLREGGEMILYRTFG